MSIAAAITENGILIEETAFFASKNSEFLCGFMILQMESGI